MLTFATWQPSKNTITQVLGIPNLIASLEPFKLIFNFEFFEFHNHKIVNTELHSFIIRKADLTMIHATPIKLFRVDHSEYDCV